MFGYLRFLPDFLWAIVRRWDTACGIAIGIVLVVVLGVIEVRPERTVTVTLSVMALLLLETGYGVYRQERAMRSELEARVLITGKVGSSSLNIPDPGEDKVSLKVHVYWEMWASEEIATDRLALNIIYIYKKRWWQFWKKKKSPIFGMTKNGQDSTQYRRTLGLPGAMRPDKDDGEFSWIGNREKSTVVQGFELELVLMTGMPVITYRVPIFMGIDMEGRGTNRPL